MLQAKSAVLVIIDPANFATDHLVPASGFRDSTLPAGAMIREGWVVLTHLRSETKALVLWHNESRAEMGGCHAPVGR
jgi:hypothetical protein